MIEAENAPCRNCGHWKPVNVWCNATEACRQHAQSVADQEVKRFRELHGQIVAESVTGQAVERAFVVEPFIDAWTESGQRAEVFTPAAPVSVASVIAADKATTEAAWPEVPWRVKHVGDEGNKSWHVVDAFGLFICSLEDEVEARFIAASRSRLPVYIAAIEAVTALHSVEKRYHDGSAEWSCDTPEEAADMGDIEVEDVEYFEICSHCGELEMCDGADEKHYMTAMWPCPTVRALAVLAPSTEETK